MSDEEKNYKYGYLFHRFSESIKNQKTWTDIFKDWVFILLSFFVVTICILTIYGIYLLALDLVFEASGEPGKENFANIRNSLFILAALIGIPFFLWRTWIAQQQSHIADRQAETARDRAYTELFTKAIEQLGAEKPAKKVIMGIDQNPTTIDDYVPNIEVRIGAIYALERIMKDSEKDAAAVVDTLAAYIRENCGEPEELECEIPVQQNGQSIADWVNAIKIYVGSPHTPQVGSLVARARALKNPTTNRADIKTALTVLGRRPLWLKNPSHFKDDKRQRADLSNVNLQGWNLTGVDLEHCNLTNANMQGADMNGAEMQGADMYHAEMQGASMKGAQMQVANMSFAQMQGAKMNDTKMQGAFMNVAKMQGTNMNNALMQDTVIRSAEMQGAFMKDAQMQGVNMNFAQMQGAYMKDAQMQGAFMNYAEINEVQITEARKTAASVISVDFTKTEFDFEELQAQLPAMFGHKELTTLPESMDIPEHWSKADMSTNKGIKQYYREWEAFKKKMGVE